MKTNVESAVYLVKRMLIDNIWRAARIEGLNTTIPKTDAILRGIPVETTYEESSFIIGMKRGWDYVLKNLGKDNSLLTVMELHEATCNGLVNKAGFLRDGAVRISGTNYYPEVPNVDVVYKDLGEVSLISNPVQRALVIFCYLSRDQLFWDGNKRMAQLMANKVLVESGVGILSIGLSSDDMTLFNKLLTDYYLSSDASELCKYLYGCIEYVQ